MIAKLGGRFGENFLKTLLGSQIPVHEIRNVEPWAVVERYRDLQAVVVWPMPRQLRFRDAMQRNDMSTQRTKGGKVYLQRDVVVIVIAVTRDVVRMIRKNQALRFHGNRGRNVE
jgi:hypothetical protein